MESGATTSRSPEPSASPQRSAHDLLFLIAFVVQLGILLVAAANATGGATGVWLTKANADNTFHAIVLSAAFGSLFGVGWAGLFLTELREKLVFLSQFVAAGLLCTHAVILYVSGYWLTATVLLSIAVGDCIWVLWARQRLTFVNVLLDLVAEFLLAHRVIVYITLVCVVTQALFLIYWGSAFVSILSTSSGGLGTVSGIILMFLCLRWTCHVIKRVLTVVVAATFCRWLVLSSGIKRTQLDASLSSDSNLVGITFEDDDLQDEEEVVAAIDDANQSQPSSPFSEEVEANDAVPLHIHTIGPMPLSQTHQPAAAWVTETYFEPPDPLRSLRYAISYSLGSICAGALVGVASPVLWAVQRLGGRMKASPNATVATLGHSLLSLSSNVLQVSHKYAYIRVALRGSSWFNAASRTWTMFESKGIEGIVQDDCSDRLLLFGCYTGAGLLALINGMTADAGAQSWLLAAAVVFWFGFVGVGLPLTVVEACVSSLFVCFADIPTALSQKQPIVFHRFVRIAELYHYVRRTNSYSQASRTSSG